MAMVAFTVPLKGLPAAGATVKEKPVRTLRPFWVFATLPGITRGSAEFAAAE